jgi:RNA-binding protein 23/39
MDKLNRDNAIQMPPMPAYIQQPTLVISRCLLLKNMFNPDEEETSDWDQEIKSDVMEECSKYGYLNHIFVEKYSQVSLGFLLMFNMSY